MLSLLLLISLACAEIVLYYPVSRAVSPGLVRQMKADVARHVERSRNTLRATKENGTAADVLRVAMTNHIIGLFAAHNAEACSAELCSQYKRGLRDPCVGVSYDEDAELCAVRYVCKIVDLGGGQKAVAPISPGEAGALHAAQKPRPKFRLFI